MMCTKIEYTVTSLVLLLVVTTAGVKVAQLVAAWTVKQVIRRIESRLCQIGKNLQQAFSSKIAESFVSLVVPCIAIIS